MLVLTRKAGEQLVIAGDITVRIVSIEGGKVRLGIDAPPEVHIVRQELLESRVNQADRPHLVTV